MVSLYFLQKPDFKESYNQRFDTGFKPFRGMACYNEIIRVPDKMNLVSFPEEIHKEVLNTVKCHIGKCR